METVLVGPAKYSFVFMPTLFFSFTILIIGISIFSYIIAIRLSPLVMSSSDYRCNDLACRSLNFFKIWFLQYRHPKYLFAGIIHIVIFFGFITLSLRSIELVVLGIYDGFVFPFLKGKFGYLYAVIKDYSSTFVLIACIVASFRRVVLKPSRYDKYGKSHFGEALLVLIIISFLMISESIFEVSGLVANKENNFDKFSTMPLTTSWLFEKLIAGSSFQFLQKIHIFFYYLHDLLFFFFLCFLPLGKHFHVITSFFNVFFMKLHKGKIKPVKYGVSIEELDNLESFGVKRLEDFTWKHILDFYTCADCGRCSDNCPANIVGRPLSPRFISIKGRDIVFKNYPIYPYGAGIVKGDLLVDKVYNEDEIWSCTTCGACEEECPLGIEYIDKIVDLRRGLVDDGRVPQSLQKPLISIEKRGNPWGKLEKKRADWVKLLPDNIKTIIFDKKSKKLRLDNLYFVDSVTSYDERMQQIALSTTKILSKFGGSVGILGKNEKDSGNEVRRFGEEMLFQSLKDFNTENIINFGAERIVVSDPHALNTLKNEYRGIPAVRHITEFVSELVSLGKIELNNPDGELNKVYTYHDPCYLGRHNGIYESPREVIRSIKGLVFSEMPKNKDRSFCCGGGGLALFHEVEEKERMGVRRVKMAFESGANVLITACPFCLVNVEDSIKIAGLEGKMEVIDFSELVVKCFIL